MISFVQQYWSTWQNMSSNKTSLGIGVLFVVLVCTLQSNLVYANEYYQKGLNAYFDQDYEQAKFQWLQGAKQGEVKSMFNLGLLHEQSRIDNPDPVKAEEWFALAGKSGYLPADYHLALRIISNGGDQQRADALIGNAASKGFSPAINYLNGDDASVLAAIASAQSSAEQKNTLEVEGASDQKGSESLSKKKSKDYLSEAWILSKRPNYWTIQLLAFSDEARVKAFIKDNKLNDKAAYFLEKSSDKSLYKLIYGAYKTKDLADFSRQNLHADLKQHGPWLRSMESVQALIKAQ